MQGSLKNSLFGNLWTSEVNANSEQGLDFFQERP